MNYANNDHKTVIVIRSGIRASEAFNAATHLALGFCHADASAFCFETYRNHGVDLAAISTYPVIVMTTKSNAHLARLVAESREARIAVAGFTRSMIGASLVEQLQAVETDDNPDYLAAIVFGPSETLRALTKRFSLMTE